MPHLSSLKDLLSIFHGNILILFLSWILMRFSDTLVYTYFSLFVLKLNGTPYIIGLINFISNIVLALIQPLGGFIADFYGRRRIIVLMSFCLAFSNLIFIFANSWIHILIGSIVNSLFLIYVPALNAIMADSLPPGKRGLGFSVSRMIGVVSIISPLIAGFLVSSYDIVYGVKIAYLISLILYLIAAFIRVKLRETVSVRGDYPDNSLHKIYFNAITSTFKSLTHAPMVLKRFLFISVILSCSLYLSGPFFLIYAKNILGISEFQWAISMSLYHLLSFLSAIFIGRLIDVFGCKIPLVISCLLQSIALLLFLHSDFKLLVLLFILWAIIDSMLLISNDALLANLTPSVLRGRIYGFMNLLSYFSMSLFSFIGGFLYEYYLPSSPFILNSILFFFSAILLYLLISEPKIGEL